MHVESRIPHVQGEGGAFYATRSIAHVDDPGLPYKLEVDIGILYGRPVCLALTATQRDGGSPVTRSGLNSLPVEQIVREAAARSSVMLRSSENGSLLLTPPSREEVAAVEKSLRPRRGRRGDPEARRALLERVARMYKELVGAGVQHPKPPIAGELGYSQSYIGAMVAEARKQGLLGAPPGPGKAGEVVKPKSRPRSRNMAAATQQEKAQR
jgi:hypothetical protein